MTATRPSRASIWKCGTGRSSPSSARTARARPPRWKSWKDSAQRTAGEVSVLGQDPAAAGGTWRDRVGVVLQESEPEPGLSVRECLAMYAGFYRAPRDIDETIALVGLTAKAGALGTRLSGGQRRRLDFALALIGDPELIFLDEPTTGFDPSARRAAWEVIAGLRELGKTIFLTTHYMDEAEYLADRIAVLAAGRIVAEAPRARSAAADRMNTSISFTLPHGLVPRDLPAGLSPLAEPGPAGRPSCTPRARSSTCRCSATGHSATASTCPTSTSTGRPWKRSTCPSPAPRAQRTGDDPPDTAPVPLRPARLRSATASRSSSPWPFPSCSW